MSIQQIQDERNELASIIKHARKTGDRHTITSYQQAKVAQRLEVYRPYSLLRKVRQSLS